MKAMSFRNITKGYNKVVYVSDNVKPINVLYQLKEGNTDSWKYLSSKQWEPKMS